MKLICSFEAWNVILYESLPSLLVSHNMHLFPREEREERRNLRFTIYFPRASMATGRKKYKISKNSLGYYTRVIVAFTLFQYKMNNRIFYSELSVILSCKQNDKFFIYIQYYNITIVFSHSKMELELA